MYRTRLFSILALPFALLACLSFSEIPTATATVPASPVLVATPTVTPSPQPSPNPPAVAAGAARPALVAPYDIGQPVLTELYVSPTGDDANSGADMNHPLQTLTAAWNQVPVTLTTTGYRINLLPGVYPCEPGPEETNCINYLSDRLGAYQTPLIIRAYNGPGSVTVRGGLNFNNVQYLYLLDLNLIGGMPLPINSSGNNLLHLERGDHVLLRGLSVLGPACNNDTCNDLQEVLKVNQTQYLYVEDSIIGGAWHSAVDYFVVQYGHFLNNRLHTAGQWCMYIKGGSAYLTIAGNELYGCQLGFQSGQSANLAVMRPPWFHYETYDIKFVNNVLHDIPGVGLSAAGAYNTLFAYNTLYRVATSTGDGYGLMQAIHGERNCTPIDEIPNVMLNCPAFTSQGAWGPNGQADSLPAIPNRNVYVYNNLFYNPSPSQTLYFHFAANGPIPRPANFQNSPSPAQTDDQLIFRGNVVWNGPTSSLPLFGSTGGGPIACQAGSTCTEAQVLADNTINQFEPQLIDPTRGDFRPVSGSNIFSATTFTIPDFTWDTFTPAVPAGTLTNTVSTDRAGNARIGSGPPGAYAASPSGQHSYLPLLVVRHGSAAHLGTWDQLTWVARPRLGGDHWQKTSARLITLRLSAMQATALQCLQLSQMPCYLMVGCGR